MKSGFDLPLQYFTGTYIFPVTTYATQILIFRGLFHYAPNKEQMRCLEMGPNPLRSTYSEKNNG